MTSCPHCGAALAPGAVACSACGRPVTAAPPPSNKTFKLVVIVAVAGGCLLFAIAMVGILAALIIPNFLDALMKAKQKRTMADMRSIGAELESYRGEHETYPGASNAAELQTLLAGQGLQGKQGWKGKLKDGWQHELRFTCLSQAEARCGSYELDSPGKDGVFEHAPGEYDSSSFAPTEYDSDIVLKDGEFLRWPQLQPR